MAVIFGTNGQDTIHGTSAPETLNGWDANNTPGNEGPSTDFDLVFAGPGDIANGGNGNDWLYGAGANVTINGGDGSDLITIDGSAANDVIDGGAGFDKLTANAMYAGTAGSNISIADPTVEQFLANGTRFVNIEQLSYMGDSGTDVLTGGAFQDQLDGYLGNDILEGGAGGDHLFGGGGVDTIVYGNSSAGVNVSISGVFGSASGGEASGDTIMDVENIWGSEFGDQLTGSDQANELRGNGGDDVLKGLGGNDILNGGAGTDTAVFVGAAASYTTAYNAVTGELFVSGGTDGRDIVKDIEVIQFSDGTKTFAELVTSSEIIRNASISTAISSSAEGNGGTVPFSFTVTLDGTVNAPQTIAYAVQLGGANSASANDFLSALTGSVTFLPGELSKTITIDVASDFNVESDETFRVELSSSSLVINIAAANASATIVNDDVYQSVSIVADQAGVVEGNAGRSIHTFTVVLDSPAKSEQSVGYAIDLAYPAAVAESDFVEPTTGTVTFAVGETTKTISIEVVGDQWLETDETFAITLTNASAGLLIATSTASSTISNDDAFNVFNGTEDDDYLSGNAGVDHLFGMGGSDVLNGFEGDDELDGGAGKDVLVGGRGNDIIKGGTDPFDDDFFNVVAYFNETNSQGGNRGVVVNLSDVAQGGQAANTATDAFGDTDRLENINTIIGTHYNDVIFGRTFDGAGIDGNGTRFYGFAGNDKLVGSTGIDLAVYDADIEYGGIPGRGIAANLSSTAFRVAGKTIAANTIHDGFGGVDSVSKIEAVRGTAFNDYFFGGKGDEYFVGLNGDDNFNGGAGRDTVSYRLDSGYGLETTGVVVNLSSVVVVFGGVSVAGGKAIDGFGGTDTFKNIEIVYATDFDDQLYASLAGSEFHAEDGADTLIGGRGNDLLDGGLGEDYMRGGAGNDVYVVDSSADQVIEAKAQGTDTIETTLSTFSLATLTDVENLKFNGTGDFVGTGNSATNRIEGGSGDDNLNGHFGADKLVGGAGEDVLTGGEGNDAFVFDVLSSSAAIGDDIIADFTGGRGRGDVVQIDRDLGFTSIKSVLAALTVVGNDKVLNFKDGSSITFADRATLVFSVDDFLLT
jgi:Ca2+-binding RTX toxin-like protein